jgi:succinyl-diaminopimelate desuccinylase
MDSKELMDAVAEDKDKIVKSLCSMIEHVAVGPENGGPGEAERGKFLVALAKSLGLKDIEVLESRDPSVLTGKRPNIIVRVKGATSKNMWVVTHMDTVPEGDLSAWKSPPFKPKIVKGRIYGRGSEDNGQELMASLFGLATLVKKRVTPECNIGLVFVSDEEHGNVHGIDFLIPKKIVKKGDFVVVPDHGEPNGDAISIVEKGIAWLNVEVIGKQTHGSTPDEGINAFEVAARYMVAAVDSLRKSYPTKNPLFDPPASTFVPTRCDANGPNINTVPGKQVFAFDFRVLPDYSLDAVISELRRIAKKFERSTGARINISFLQRADAAPKTATDAEIVKRLSKAIETVRGIKPHPIGAGGGTCAAPFRRAGIDAVVWSTIPGTAHDANEYANIADLVADAKVYALLFAGKNVKNV